MLIQPKMGLNFLCTKSNLSIIQKKSAKKITGKYLGIITENGLLLKVNSTLRRPKVAFKSESKDDILADKQIVCKEYCEIFVPQTYSIN